MYENLVVRQVVGSYISYSTYTNDQYQTIIKSVVLLGRLMGVKDALNKGTGKYIVFALLYIGWCISYIDRAAISIALASIGKEFHLDASVLGVVLSTFFIGYAIMQIPGGWLSDKFGSKKVIMTAILLWSIFTLFLVSHGL